MKFNSWKLGLLWVIEVTGEGREIMAGQRTIRAVVQARVMLGPGAELVSLWIEPRALIVTGPEEQYAISIDGAPADVESLLEMI